MPIADRVQQLLILDLNFPICICVASVELLFVDSVFQANLEKMSSQWNMILHYARTFRLDKVQSIYESEPNPPPFPHDHDILGRQSTDHSYEW